MKISTLHLGNLLCWHFLFKRSFKFVTNYMKRMNRRITSGRITELTFFLIISFLLSDAGDIFSYLFYYPTCNCRRFTTFSLEHFTSIPLPFVSAFQPFFIETTNLYQLRRGDGEIFTEYNK